MRPLVANQIQESPQFLMFLFGGLAYGLETFNIREIRVRGVKPAASWHSSNRTLGPWICSRAHIRAMPVSPHSAGAGGRDPEGNQFRIRIAPREGCHLEESFERGHVRPRFMPDRVKQCIKPLIVRNNVSRGLRGLHIQPFHKYYQAPSIQLLRSATNP